MGLVAEPAGHSWHWKDPFELIEPLGQFSHAVRFQCLPPEQMHLSELASDDVPVGHMEHEDMLGFLKVPGIQEQLSDPTVEVDNSEQGVQADIWESL